LTVCETLPDNNRPEAFKTLIEEQLGWEVSGIPCFHGICDFREKLSTYDGQIVIGMILLIIATRFCKCWADMSVKNYKRKCQKANAARLQEFRSEAMRSRGKFPQPTTQQYQQPGYGGYGGGSGLFGGAGTGLNQPQPAVSPSARR